MLGRLMDAQPMTSTTSSLHHSTDYDLGPAAALRMLRSVAYREWYVYRPPAGIPEAYEVYEVPVVSEVFTDSVLSLDPAWLVEHSEESEESEECEGSEDGDLVAVAPVPTIDLRATGNWYLNEVPAEWIEDSLSEDRPSSPMSA